LFTSCTASASYTVCTLKDFKDFYQLLQNFIYFNAKYLGSSLSLTQDIDFVWHTHQLSTKRYGLCSPMKMGEADLKARDIGKG